MDVLYKFPRVKQHPFLYFFGCWAMMIVGMGLYGITNGFTDWLLPVWEMPLGTALFITVFMSVWFGFGFWCANFLIRGLQTVRITQDEIRICLGPLVLRRLQISDIRTVIRTGDGLHPPGSASLAYVPRNRHGGEKREEWRLVLSRIPAEELQIQSRSAQEKLKFRDQSLRMSDGIYVQNESIRKYIARAFSKNRFWMTWSAEAEHILRNVLNTAVFIQ